MRVKIFKFSARAVLPHSESHPSPVVSGSKFSQNQPQVGPICPDFCARAHLSIYTGMDSRILLPFRKLKANCLNIRSMILIINFGNFALFPWSCRWLMPKYCSTMYRNFEMDLLRWISRSVNLALILSLRMMPSPILFKAMRFIVFDSPIRIKIPGIFFDLTVFIQITFRDVGLLLEFFKLFIGNRFACRLNKPCIDSHPFINGQAFLMKLFDKSTVDLDHGISGQTLPKPRESGMIRRRAIQRHIQKRLKRDTVINEAFKFRVGTDPEPLLKQKTFEQKQGRIGSFSFTGFTGLIVF